MPVPGQPDQPALRILSMALAAWRPDRADGEIVVGGHHLRHRRSREPSPASPQRCPETVRSVGKIEQKVPVGVGERARVDRLLK